jgi:hypothetical protein
LVFDPLFFAGDPRAAGLLPGDIEFDPLSLVVVPEPSTLVLVALGGAALIGWSMSAPRKLRSLDG